MLALLCVAFDLTVLVWKQIASVMKEEYAPYASVVMPHLLQRATDPSDVEISVSHSMCVVC